MPEVHEEALEAHGAQGQPIALPLPHGPATGYSWMLDLPAGLTRVEDSPGRAPAPGQELGAPHGGTIQVTAPPGRHTITARLARPWAPDDPIRVVRINLTVE